MTGNSYISTETYYYNGDHLGSASLITDSVGAVVEELRYMPYGELLRDVHHGIYGERFTFTGQERDPESDWYHLTSLSMGCASAILASGIAFGLHHT